MNLTDFKVKIYHVVCCQNKGMFLKIFMLTHRQLLNGPLVGLLFRSFSVIQFFNTLFFDSPLISVMILSGFLPH